MRLDDLIVHRCGGYDTKRIYRPESFAFIRISSFLGFPCGSAARTLTNAAAVLDVSGGDSFTDLYGAKRYHSVALPKVMSIALKKRLILLPQTYGPFRSQHFRRHAEFIVRSSTMAWARDKRSYAALQELLGNEYEPRRHRCGVDLAFGLPTMEPAGHAVSELKNWMESSSPIAGVNVSGLLMNRPTNSSRQYGLKADYQEVIAGLLRHLLSEVDTRVVLLPHVVTPVEHYESDIKACNQVAEMFPEEVNKRRVIVSPPLENPTHAKWIIGRCDWFCGTRMHATIAALSSGVPAAAIAYSPKTLGVFECCNQGEHVADPRSLDTAEVIERLWTSWTQRNSTRVSLRTALPQVIEEAARQMDEIAVACTATDYGQTEAQ